MGFKLFFIEAKMSIFIYEHGDKEGSRRKKNYSTFNEEKDASCTMENHSITPKGEEGTIIYCLGRPKGIEIARIECKKNGKTPTTGQVQRMLPDIVKPRL